MKDKYGIPFWKAVHKIVKAIDFSKEFADMK
jgi:hypothetical protein